MGGVKYGSIEELPEQHRIQVAAKLAIEDGTAIRRSKQEQDREPALDKEKAVPKYDCPVCLRVTVYQRRSFDVDNCETKAIQDALVANAILADDRLEEVPIIIKHGLRCKTLEEERTTIELFVYEGPEHPVY